MRQSCMAGERMMLRRVLDMSTGAIARYGRYAHDDRGVVMEQCRYLLLLAFGIHLQDIPSTRSAYLQLDQLRQQLAAYVSSLSMRSSTPMSLSACLL